MNITIVGAGNIGTQFAVHCAEKKHNVTLFTSKPNEIDKELIIVDEKQDIIHKGKITDATSDAKKAFENADVIFVTMPAFCMEDVANKIVPYVRSGTKIGIIPGAGGGECAFKTCIEKGCIIFGLQRVPSVARLKSYGKIVCATGYRKQLYVAALPWHYTKECCGMIEEIFEITCGELPNYLNLTLTPSNPILHTTRLRVLFKDYSEGMIYKKLPLFYENWDNETSELLLRCDDEVQRICMNLKEFNLSFVKSLREHYECNTVQEFTAKISSIEGFKGLKTPSVSVDNGEIPDFSSRYFTADFAYGLMAIRQIAAITETIVDNIEETLDWYLNLKRYETIFSYEKYGIINRKELIRFYNI